jgi:hypothetical protein
VAKTVKSTGVVVTILSQRERAVGSFRLPEATAGKRGIIAMISHLAISFETVILH